MTYRIAGAACLWLACAGSAFGAGGVSYNPTTGALWIWGDYGNNDITVQGDKYDVYVTIDQQGTYGPYDVGDMPIIVNLGNGTNWFEYADQGTYGTWYQPIFYVTGGTGADYVLTGDRDDYVDLGDGNDVASTFGGSDTHKMGNGNDTSFTGAGPDIADGGENTGDHDVIWQGGAYDAQVVGYEQIHTGG